MRAVSTISTLLIALTMPALAEPEVGGVEGGGGVVVTGTRTESRLADTPIETEVISHDALQKAGARTVGEALSSAGLALPSESFAGQGAGLQGLSARQVLILVDGERMTGQVDGVTDLSRLRTEHIDRIEIVRGSGSSVYGADAMGGVINIITRRGTRDWQGEVELAGASDSAVDAAGLVSGSLGPLRARLSGGWHQAEAFDLDPSDVGTNGSALDDGQIGSRFDLKLGGGWRADAGVDWQLRRRVGIDAPSTGAVLDRELLDEMFDARLGLRHKGEGGQVLRATLHGQLHRSQFDLDQRGSDQLDVYEDNRFQRADAHVSFTATAWRWHRITSGVDGVFEGAETPRLESGSATRLRGAVYVQDEWTLNAEPYLILVGGARVDVDEWFGTQPTPRLAVRFDPVETLELRASTGLGFRAPDFKELFLRFENPSVGYVVTGTPDLVPETTLSIQAGARWWARRWLTTRINLFRHAIDDLITILPVDGTLFRYANIASAISQGVEAEVMLTVLPGTGLTMGYTFTDAREEGSDLQLPGRARHRAYAELTGRVPAWRADLTVRTAVNGPRPFYDQEGNLRRSSPTLAIATARASVAIVDSIRVFARGENLFDAADIDAAPIRPRRVGAGLIGQF